MPYCAKSRTPISLGVMSGKRGAPRGARRDLGVMVSEEWNKRSEPEASGPGVPVFRYRAALLSEGDG